MAASTTGTYSIEQYLFPRYDERSIAEPVLRTGLRKEVMITGESNDRDLTVYYVQPDKRYHANLLSFRVWEVPELRWVQLHILLRSGWCRAEVGLLS
ncbi:hypothetical protein [Erwinia sp. PsM31]|uniref:hypothetical protein n=1 Tax=Erwinia sp. PsM31 TaxID=3030535 RepID=UPI00263AA058|nr:hypothetical protein [Erwinia sp. PsM31]MDN4628277.1 hypothetical protein [Erwinia sp. PsM31]